MLLESRAGALDNGNVAHGVGPRATSTPRRVERAKAMKKYSPRGLDIRQKIAWFTKRCASGCHLWTGTITRYGYGQVAHGGPGRVARVHRLVWELARGPIPEGLCVCHACDVRHCVNIDHLFLGSQLENVRDMIAKGRAAVVRGERHGMFRFTDAQVDEMRAMRAAGLTQQAIADRIGCCNQYVSAVLAGKYRTGTT